MAESSQTCHGARAHARCDTLRVLSRLGNFPFFRLFKFLRKLYGDTDARMGQAADWELERFQRIYRPCMNTHSTGCIM